MKIPFIIHTVGSKIYKVNTEHKPIVFGRMGSHVHIEDQECSRRHCIVSFSNNELIMEDLESKNGTLVNGVRTSKCRIFIGDIIKIGLTKIMLDDNLLTQEQKEIFTYKGDPSKRSMGDVTLQLDNEMESSSTANKEEIHEQKDNKLYSIQKKR